MNGTSNISNDLFYKVRSRFSGLKLGTETGEITINPEEARFFDFDYKDGESSLGHITISLAEPNSMKVYFSSGITESMEGNQKSRWYSFLKELRSFAKRRLMAFDTRDISKDNLDRRDFEFLTAVGQPKLSTDTLVKQVGESIMNENQLYGTNRVSYQRLMDTRLIIKHSKALQDDQQPGARSRNISALFVENQDGERFKYPFIHLAGARAMQRHVANGGLPYDDLGKSIIEISEQIAQLKNFSNYVVRNDLMNSDTNSIVEQSTMALNSLREKISKLSKQSFYEQYKENFAKAEPLEIPQSMVEEFKEKFTVKSFREEISTVFPLLYNIMQETSSVDYDDIVNMATNEQTINDEATIDDTEDELEKFEQWIMDLGEESSILSDDREERTEAVEELNELVGEHFPAGVDGIQAIESLKGIIDDPQLFNEIKAQAKQDPDSCVRPLVKEWLETNAPEVVQELDFGDMTEGDIDPNKHPQTKDYGRGDDGDDLPFDADDDASDKDEFGNTIKHRARHLARKGMRQAMDVKELAEFINSFYDRNTGTFPKGPEGVVTMVGKKFGEQAEQVARKFVERMAPHQERGGEQMQELARIRELAGMKIEADDRNEGKIDWNSDDVKEIEAMHQKFYVKDTPEGKLLLGDDVGGYFYTDHNGGEREGNITFVYNMDTGKFLEYPEDYNDSYGYLSDREVREFVKDVVREVQSKMGEGVTQEAGIDPNQHPQTKDYGSGPSPELEDEVAKLLKRFEDDAMEVGAYGNPDFKKVVAMIAKGDPGAALEEVSYSYSDQDGGEVYRLDPYLDDLDDEFRALADMFGESVNPESGVSESQDDIYTINNPDMERDAETGREEPDEIEVKVEFSSYDDEFEIDKIVRVDTGEDITDKVSNDRQLYFNLVHDVQQREQGRERDYNESIRDDVTPELEAIKRLSGITQGLGL